MKVSKARLTELIENKLHRAGLGKEHSSIVADVLVHADVRGVHSHGAMRTEYYSERIAKGGINNDPQFSFTKTGPSTGIFEGDNGAGHVAAKLAMDEAIEVARENGVAVIGVKRISHSGALSYFVRQAAEAKLVGISVCQSDPMVVPYGGAEPYYGTNPIAFAAPSKDEEKMVMFDMATTVAAWGKILHARTKGEKIPEDWAVDENGTPTTDPFKVNALLPIAGAKGFGLSMMVDILSGVLLGVPFGGNVTSMYHDLSQNRELGQLHIVINPEYFRSLDGFLEDITKSMEDIHGMKPAEGFDEVRYPGLSSYLREKEHEKNGIEIVDEVYEYLTSEMIHNDRYDNKGTFAK